VEASFKATKEAERVSHGKGKECRAPVGRTVVRGKSAEGKRSGDQTSFRAGEAKEKRRL